MENASDSSTLVEQCNKCHSSISLVGHLVENVTCVKKGKWWHRTEFHYGFLYYRFLLLKSSWPKRKKKINLPFPPQHTHKPSQCTFLNSPALLTRAGEAISLSVLLTDSYLYYLNSGCAEQYSAIALLLKATTIYFFENQLHQWECLTQASILQVLCSKSFVLHFEIISSLWLFFHSPDAESLLDRNGMWIKKSQKSLCYAFLGYSEKPFRKYRKEQHFQIDLSHPLKKNQTC